MPDIGLLMLGILCCIVVFVILVCCSDETTLKCASLAPAYALN